MERLLKDGCLFKLLEKVDRELAQMVRAAGCRYCGGRLHCGDFPRKARGGPGWDERYSFDCSKCRRRHTPPSVRFLGRKVYVGVVVVLVAAMMHGPNARRVAQLHDALGLDVRTLRRWHQWWLEIFVQKPFWKAVRGRFMPVLDEAVMPYCLVDAFHAWGREELIKLMRFLAPITTGSWKGVAAM
jgi:hypothetical protein